jgi:hypothetical protein
MAFQEEVLPVQVEVRWFCSPSSLTVDSWLYHFGVEGSRLYDLCKPLTGVYPSQTSPSDAQDYKLIASSLLRLWHKVS